MSAASICVTSLGFTQSFVVGQSNSYEWALKVLNGTWLRLRLIQPYKESNNYTTKHAKSKRYHIQLTFANHLNCYTEEEAAQKVEGKFHFCVFTKIENSTKLASEGV